MASTESALEALAQVEDGDDESEKIHEYLQDLQKVLQDSTISDAMMKSGNAEFVRSMATFRVQNADELRALLKKAKRSPIDFAIGTAGTISGI